ncbi:MAG: DUF2304 domain-containing protein [Acidimicrobiia bacterium]|nr:DUF2304 domain-containing protein [Acidimicrobiia bacterium]
MTLSARIFVLVVAVVVLFFILRLVGQRKLRSKYALLWLTVGLLIVPIAAFPALLDWTAERLGITYAPALLLMMASTVLLLIVIHYSWELSRLESRSRRLAEEVALLGARLEAVLAIDDEDAVEDAVGETGVEGDGG